MIEVEASNLQAVRVATQYATGALPMQAAAASLLRRKLPAVVHCDLQDAFQN